MAACRNLAATLPGGARISGTPFIGLLGADILAQTAVGDFGAGVLANDALGAGLRYRALITSSTFAPGAFWLNENGSGYFTAGGAAVYELYEDNLLVATPAANRTINGSMGAAAVTGAGGVASGEALGLPTVVLGVVPPASILGAGGVASGAAVGLPTVTPTVPTAPIGQRVIEVGVRKSPVHLAPLDVAETDDIAVRFGPALVTGETVSLLTFTAEARIGADPAPAPLRVGNVQQFGSDAIQRVDGALAVAGVTYLLRCAATLSSGRKVVGVAFLQVVRRA